MGSPISRSSLSTPVQEGLKVGRYLLTRITIVGSTLVVGVFIATVVANLGGYIDAIVRDRINSTIMGRIMGGWLEDVDDQDQANAIIEQTRLQMEAAAGLNDSFLMRCLKAASDVSFLYMRTSRVSRPSR